MKLVAVLALLCCLTISVLSSPVPQQVESNVSTESEKETGRQVAAAAPAAPAPASEDDDDDEDDDDVDLDITGDDEDDDEEEEDDDEDEDYLERFIEDILGGKHYFLKKYLSKINSDRAENIVNIIYYYFFHYK